MPRLARGSITLYDVTDGTNATLAVLTNEADVAPAPFGGDGIVTSIVSEMRVYDGNTRLTDGVIYSITSANPSQGVTAVINTSTGAISFLGTLTADTVSFTFRATRGTIAFEKVMTITRAQGGEDGTSAEVIRVYADRYSFSYDAEDVGSGVDINITANTQGLAGLYTWSTSNGVVIGDVDNAITFSRAMFESTTDNSNDNREPVTITAVRGGRTDTITIYAVEAGGAGTSSRLDVSYAETLGATSDTDILQINNIALTGSLADAIPATAETQSTTVSGSLGPNSGGTPEVQSFDIQGSLAASIDAVSEVQDMVVSGSLPGDIAAATEVQTLAYTGSRSNELTVTNDLFSIEVDEDFNSGTGTSVFFDIDTNNTVFSNSVTTAITNNQGADDTLNQLGTAIEGAYSGSSAGSITDVSGDGFDITCTWTSPSASTVLNTSDGTSQYIRIFFNGGSGFLWGYTAPFSGVTFDAALTGIANGALIGAGPAPAGFTITKVGNGLRMTASGGSYITTSVGTTRNWDTKIGAGMFPGSGLGHDFVITDNNSPSQGTFPDNNGGGSGANFRYNPASVNSGTPNLRSLAFDTGQGVALDHSLVPTFASDASGLTLDVVAGQEGMTDGVESTYTLCAPSGASIGSFTSSTVPGGADDETSVFNTAIQMLNDHVYSGIDFNTARSGKTLTFTGQSTGAQLGTFNLSASHGTGNGDISFANSGIATVTTEGRAFTPAESAILTFADPEGTIISPTISIFGESDGVTSAEVAATIRNTAAIGGWNTSGTGSTVRFTDQASGPATGVWSVSSTNADISFATSVITTGVSPVAAGTTDIAVTTPANSSTETVTINGGATLTTATAIATQLRTGLNNITDFTDDWIVGGSGTTMVFTRTINGDITGTPFSATSTNSSVSFGTTSVTDGTPDTIVDTANVTFTAPDGGSDTYLVSGPKDSSEIASDIVANISVTGWTPTVSGSDITFTSTTTGNVVGLFGASSNDPNVTFSTFTAVDGTPSIPAETALFSITGHLGTEATYTATGPLTTSELATDVADNIVSTEYTFADSTDDIVATATAFGLQDAPFVTVTTTSDVTAVSSVTTAGSKDGDFEGGNYTFASGLLSDDTYVQAQPRSGDIFRAERSVSWLAGSVEPPVGMVPTDYDYVRWIGEPGVSASPVSGYKRSSTLPTDKPSATRIFTFATGSFDDNDLGSGWTAAIPSGTEDLYVANAVASAAGLTATITADDWGPAALLGATPINGDRTRTVYLYQASTSATIPLLPADTEGFNATLGTAVSTGDWDDEVPATFAAGERLYLAQLEITQIASVGDWTVSNSWVGAQASGSDGTNGTDGDAGPRFAQRTIYISAPAANIPSNPVATITWGTGALSSITTGWSENAPTQAASSEDVVYFSNLIFIDLTGSAVSTPVIGGDATAGVSFSGLVSFNPSSRLLEEDGVTITNIDGGVIQTGVVSGGVDGNTGFTYNNNTFEPTGNSGFVMGIGSSGGGLSVGSADRHLWWDPTNSQLQVAGEIVNLTESALAAQTGGPFTTVNGSTALTNNLDGPGAYVFVMTGAGGSGGIRNSTNTSAGGGNGGGGAGCAIFSFVWDGITPISWTAASSTTDGSENQETRNGFDGEASTFTYGGNTLVTANGGGGGNGNGVAGGTGGNVTYGTFNDSTTFLSSHARTGIAGEPSTVGTNLAAGGTGGGCCDFFGTYNNITPAENPGNFGGDTPYGQRSNSVGVGGITTNSTIFGPADDTRQIMGLPAGQSYYIPGLPGDTRFSAFFAGGIGLVGTNAVTDDPSWNGAVGGQGGIFCGGGGASNTQGGNTQVAGGAGGGGGGGGGKAATANTVTGRPGSARQPDLYWSKL